MQKHVSFIVFSLFTLLSLQAQTAWSTSDLLTGTTKNTTAQEIESNTQKNTAIALNAETMDQTVVLTWETQENQSQDRFLIQRKDGVETSFKTITEIESDGMAAQFIHFDDMPEKENTNYRLIEVKEDGTQVEHQLVPLTIK